MPNNIKKLLNSNKELLEESLTFLNLSTRSYNALRQAQINTIGNLVDFVNARGLYEIRGLGEKSIKEIFNKINELGMKIQDITVNKTEKPHLSYEELINCYYKVTENEEAIIRDELSIVEKNRNAPIDFLKVSNLALKKLNMENIFTIGELIQYMLRNPLILMRGFGFKSALEIEKELVDLNIESIFKYKDPYSFTLEKKHDIEILSMYDLVVKDGMILLPSFKIYFEDITVKKLYGRDRFINYLSTFEITKLSDLFTKYNEVKKGDTFKENIILITKLANIYINKNVEKLTDNFEVNVYAKKIAAFTKEFMFDGVLISEIYTRFTNKTKREIINQSVTIGIEQFKFYERNDKLYYNFLNLDDYFNSLPNNKEKEIIALRFEGYTLEAISENVGVTRERIRQLVAAYFTDYFGKGDEYVSIVKEDGYKKVFETYHFKEYDFLTIFNETARVYNYLNIRYKKGKKEFSAAVEDDQISKDIRRKIQKVVNKKIAENFVIYEGHYIRKSQQSLLSFYMFNFCKSSKHITEIYEGYNDFINSLNIDVSNYTTINLRAFEARVWNIENIVIGFRRTYKYYNFDDYDFEYFLQEINLESFHNYEISTLLLFKRNPDLMKVYNINSEYELHNILRRIFEKIKHENIVFNRMPMVKIGEFDRDEYLLNILKTHEQITRHDIYRIVSEELGVDEATVAGSWLIPLEQYRVTKDLFQYKGESAGLCENDFNRLKSFITKDIYLIKEIQKIWSEVFITNTKINLTLSDYRKLGYINYGSYIVRHELSPTKAFIKHLNNFKIINHEEIRPFLNISIFSSIYYRLLKNLDILPFEESAYFHFTLLEKQGITKNDLKKYVKDTVKFVHTHKQNFFTYYSLVKQGFKSYLDELGFSHYFYSSLIAQISEFPTFYFHHSRVFSISQENTKRSSLILHIVNKNKRISEMELLEHLNREYGIESNVFLIRSLVTDTDVYYDAIMETFYDSYETYYEEI